jgi:hypothetical protein
MSKLTQETLKDLNMRLRHKKIISTDINKILNEIKKEMLDSHKPTKVRALEKLLFLYLHNYDIKWATVNTFEVLTTCGLTGKRTGYIIAPGQFKRNKDMLQLLPNLIRKDFQSQNVTCISSALSLVNSVMDLSLANELVKDLEKLLNYNNNIIRKKLIISLTICAELFLKANSNSTYWDDLSIKLITLLTNKDTSTGISICIISSIQRICKIYPQKCLTVFMELMNYFSNCNTNWILIKIVDIIAMLFQYEPKFAKKKDFIKIITQKLAQTSSKSVEVQLVKLVITNLDSVNNNVTVELFQNCEERLKNLLFVSDLNLVVMSLRILKDLFNRNKLIAGNYINDILKILDDNNNKMIQNECIEILRISVDNNNYKNISDYLFKNRDKLDDNAIIAILDICTYDSYNRLTSSKDDLFWFLKIIFVLAEDEFGKNINTELKISYILRDMAQRIDILRESITNNSYDLLIKLLGKENSNNIQLNENNKLVLTTINGEENKFFEDNFSIKHADALISVLCFIIGEYIYSENFEELSNKTKILIDNFNKNKESHYIPLMNCILKLIFKTKSDDENYAKDILNNLKTNQSFIKDLEIIDFNLFLENIINSYDSHKLSNYFKSELLPLHEKAQKMVNFPNNLDLNICFPLNDEELLINTNINKKENINNNSNSNTDNNENKISIDKNLYGPDTNK